MDPETADIYGRISDDRTGRAASVTRQVAECVELCEARGWRVGTIYDRDKDRSAYSGKPRPDYIRLCADIAAGKVRRVVSWHPDRLHRSPRELEDFIDLIELHGVQVETVRAGRWDLSTPSGRLNARLLGAVARYESEHKSDRVRSALDQNVRDGKPGGGGRPYGYEPDKITVVPDEQAIVQAAARDVLAGRSLRSIAVDLNAAGEPTVSGQPWHPTSLRQILTNPRTAGYRSQGEWDEKAKKRRGRTITGRAVWQPLLDDDTWHAVVAVLSDPERRNALSTARVHLLSNLAVCGACDTGLLPHHSRSRSQTVISYTCQADGCRKVAIRQPLLERYVTEWLFRWWGNNEQPLPAADLNPADAALTQRIAGVEAQIAAADRAMELDATMTFERLATITAGLTRRLAALRAEQAQQQTTTVLRSWNRDDLRAQWDQADLERRRALLTACLERIAVRPAARRGPTFDPTRIELTLRAR